MPLEPTTPESKPVPSTVQQDITHFHITRLEILIDPNDSTATTVMVTLVGGYMDTDTFVRVEERGEFLEGEDLLEKIAETTDGTTSVYNNVKQRVWALLQARGFAPAGSVT